MGQKLRQLGISGKDRPTKRSQRITPAQFDVAGIIGIFRRQYSQSIKVTRIDDAKIIFGQPRDDSFGFDALEGFFENAGTAELYVKSHVGNDGSAIDAVVANATINNQANPMMTIKAGYKEIEQYGAEGNLSGYEIENGFRYSTTITANVLATATEIEVDAIGDIKIGDTMTLELSGGDVDIDVEEIDETNKIVKFGTTQVGVAGTAGDDVHCRGFQVRTYGKNEKGLVTELEQALGKIWLSPNPVVSEYYFENVFKSNKYLILDSLGATETAGDRFPNDVLTTTFLTSGSDGTTPSTSAHWKFNHSAFDLSPIRFIFNPETTLESYFEDLETYLKNRVKTDFPISIPTIPYNLDKDLLKEIGSRYQRSDSRLMVNVGHWLKKEDPFVTSSVAPPREIPNVGHVCGAWIRTIRDYGIHNIPGIYEIVLRGIIGVVENVDPDPITGLPKQLDDADRTELAEAGINIIQDVDGEGIKIRNFFTPSTLPEFQHGNSIAMRNFIRESVKESQIPVVNEPNVYANIIAGKSAINTFMYSLWRGGSNGRVPLGETFGQYFDDNGNASTPDDHFEVIADPSNNTNLDIKAGERTYDVFFSAPTPTGSIEVGVGLKFP